MDWLLFLAILFFINVIEFLLFYGLDGVLKYKKYEVYNIRKFKVFKYFIVNSKMKLNEENNRVYYSQDYKFTVTKSILNKQIINYILMTCVLILVVTYQVTLIPTIYLLINILLIINFVFLLYLVMYFIAKTWRNEK